MHRVTYYRFVFDVTFLKSFQSIFFKNKPSQRFRISRSEVIDIIIEISIDFSDYFLK